MFSSFLLLPPSFLPLLYLFSCPIFPPSNFFLSYPFSFLILYSLPPLSLLSLNSLFSLSLPFSPFISTLPPTPSLPLLGQPFAQELSQASIVEQNTILNNHGVDYPTHPQVSLEPRSSSDTVYPTRRRFSQTCFLSLCSNMYILPKKLAPAPTSSSNGLTTTIGHYVCVIVCVTM